MQKYVIRLYINECIIQLFGKLKQKSPDNVIRTFNFYDDISLCYGENIYSAASAAITWLFIVSTSLSIK